MTKKILILVNRTRTNKNSFFVGLKKNLPKRPAGPRLLLHRADRGSGIFADPSADRLAGLQRLHHGHQADQGIHRRHGPPQDQGQHGHRAAIDVLEMAEHLDHRAVLRRRRLPPLVEAVQRRGEGGPRQQYQQHAPQQAFTPPLPQPVSLDSE
jgi:hypothetical protein